MVGAETSSWDAWAGRGAASPRRITCVVVSTSAASHACGTGQGADTGPRCRWRRRSLVLAQPDRMVVDRHQRIKGRQVAAALCARTAPVCVRGRKNAAGANDQPLQRVDQDQRNDCGPNGVASHPTDAGARSTPPANRAVLIFIVPNRKVPTLDLLMASVPFRPNAMFQRSLSAHAPSPPSANAATGDLRTGQSRPPRSRSRCLQRSLQFKANELCAERHGSTCPRSRRSTCQSDPLGALAPSRANVGEGALSGLSSATVPGIRHALAAAGGVLSGSCDDRGPAHVPGRARAASG